MPSRSARPSVAAATIGIAGLVAVLLSGCGVIAPVEDRLPITIGTHASLGNEVVAEVYGQYLDDHGYVVSYNPGVGTREDYLDALRSGIVDLVPDFTADLLFSLDADSPATRLDEVDAALSVVLSQLELRALEPAPAERPDALVVTRAFAEAHSLVTISDLLDVPEPITIVAEPTWEGRPFGREGLGDTYGLNNWTSRPLDGATVAALAEQLGTGFANVAVIPATAAVIRDLDLVVLDDHLGLLPAQHLVPVVNADSRSLRLSDLVDTVSAELTTADLVDLISRSQSGEGTPATIAEQWLRSRGLLE